MVFYTDITDSHDHNLYTYREKQFWSSLSILHATVASLLV